MKKFSSYLVRARGNQMAPLVQQLCQDNRFVAKVCVTGQHREMLDQVLELFSITPDFDLNIMEPGQTLNGVTSKFARYAASVE